MKDRSAVDVAPNTQLAHAGAVIDIFAFVYELQNPTKNTIQRVEAAPTRITSDEVML